MSDRFAIGEIAILVKPGDWPRYQGEDCEVIAPLARREGADKSGKTFSGLAYLIRMIDGRIFIAPPSSLRKKQPPSKLSSWADVMADTNWHPKLVRTKTKA